MPYPPTNYTPPFNITRASHLVFTARDLKASRAFYTEVVGLVVSDEDDNTVWMHGIELWEILHPGKRGVDWHNKGQ